MLRPLIQDARGDRVPLVRFNLMLLPTPHGPLPRGVQEAMRSVAMSENWKVRAFTSPEYWVRGVLIGLMPPAAIFGSLFVTMATGLLRTHPTLALIVPVAMFPVVVAAMFVLVPFALTRDVRRRCAEVAVERGHCASCGYPIGGLPPDRGDGCVTCPECRAAWRPPSEGTVTSPTAAA